MSYHDPTPDHDYMEEKWKDYCSICLTHTLERRVGLDGMCSCCRNEEAMDHEYDYYEEEIE